MSKSILVTARQFPLQMIKPLENLAEVRCFDIDDIQGSLAGAQVWLGTAMDPCSKELIDNFPASMGLIANLGVGTDNIDLAAAAKRNIAVSNTPVVTEDTADLAFALLLATSRRLNECEVLLRSDNWTAGASTLGRRVHGSTLGIIGFGAIGQALARRAAGFSMNILYHGPNRKTEAEAACGADYRPSLEDLLSQSDFVSLNCPLTDETHHLINAQSLEACRPGAIIVNTGRGPLIHEQALVDALESGQLGGAGLDVFEYEPKVTPALKDLPNVVLLPHIGSATTECRGEIVARAMGNIAAFLNSGAPLDAVSSNS